MNSGAMLAISINFLERQLVNHMTAFPVRGIFVGGELKPSSLQND